VKTLYEDENYVGFLKPAGVPTTFGEQKGCFLEEVRRERPDLFSFAGFREEEGGLLYRLDNETGGLLMFAKNREAFLRFTGDENLQKIYVAEVCDWGRLEEQGTINYPIVHKSGKKMAVLKGGRKVQHRGKPIECSTSYERVAGALCAPPRSAGGKRSQSGKWVRCAITKGARHQIRVHLAAMGAQIVGDKLYGKSEVCSREQNAGKIDGLRLYCVGIWSGFLHVQIDDLIFSD
jgi:23S rRNA pseudouridine1911/1915/1917 synthase